MKIDDSWQQLLDSKINKKQQADSNRQLKRLKNIGEIEFINAKDNHTALMIVDKMIEFKRLRYKLYIPILRSVTTSVVVPSGTSSRSLNPSAYSCSF